MKKAFVSYFVITSIFAPVSWAEFQVNTRTSSNQTNLVIATDASGNFEAVWDGSNRILYVDDVEAARDTHAGLESSEGGLYIGASSTLDPASFCSGLTDDVRIYDRAITPQTIQSLAD